MTLSDGANFGQNTEESPITRHFSSPQNSAEEAFFVNLAALDNRLATPHPFHRCMRDLGTAELKEEQPAPLKSALRRLPSDRDTHHLRVTAVIVDAKSLSRGTRTDLISKRAIGMGQLRYFRIDEFHRIAPMHFHK